MTPNTSKKNKITKKKIKQNDKQGLNARGAACTSERQASREKSRRKGGCGFD